MAKSSQFGALRSGRQRPLFIANSARTPPSFLLWVSASNDLAIPLEIFFLLFRKRSFEEVIFYFARWQKNVVYIWALDVSMVLKWEKKTFRHRLNEMIKKISTSKLGFWKFNWIFYETIILNICITKCVCVYGDS